MGLVLSESFPESSVRPSSRNSIAISSSVRNRNRTFNRRLRASRSKRCRGPQPCGDHPVTPIERYGSRGRWVTNVSGAGPCRGRVWTAAPHSVEPLPRCQAMDTADRLQPISSAICVIVIPPASRSTMNERSASWGNRARLRIPRARMALPTLHRRHAGPGVGSDRRQRLTAVERSLHRRCVEWCAPSPPLLLAHRSMLRTASLVRLVAYADVDGRPPDARDRLRGSADRLR